jgi:hypothetical protein
VTCIPVLDSWMSLISWCMFIWPTAIV